MGERTSGISTARILVVTEAISVNVSAPYLYHARDGIFCPFDVDCGVLQGHPGLQQHIVQSIVTTIRSIPSVDVVAGMHASLPESLLAAHILGKPHFSIRGSRTGRGEAVRGGDPEGKRIVLVDNLPRDDDYSGVHNIDNMKGHVVGVVSIFSPDAAAVRAELIRRSIHCEILMSFPELLREMQISGKWKPWELDEMERWQRDPKNWSSTAAARRRAVIA